MKTSRRTALKAFAGAFLAAMAPPTIKQLGAGVDRLGGLRAGVDRLGGLRAYPRLPIGEQLRVTGFPRLSDDDRALLGYMRADARLTKQTIHPRILEG